MCGTNMTLGILAIDVLLFGEDQMTASGTPLKAKVPMTHLESLKSAQLSVEKGQRGTLERVGGGRGSRRRGTG
jgi:hypothetical protein